MEEGFDSSSTIGNSKAAFDDHWTMEGLARALEGTDRSIQVHVSNFEGELDPNEYCDWIASLQAFFEWKNLTEERKSSYQKFHRLRQRNDQSVADYTEHFYKLLSRINLIETDDQFVARYMTGLKFNLQSELMLHSIHSLEEAYQMALKAEEKAKWTPFRKADNSKASNEKMVAKSKKNSAPNSQHPNPHAGEGKNESGKAGSSSSFKCFRCGEAGHRSYECPTKKAEVNLVKEGQEEEEEEPVCNEELEGGIKKEYCEPNYDAESLVIRRVMTVQEDDQWLRDENDESLKLEDLSTIPANTHQEILDVLDVRSITTHRGTYTQYLVHWTGKAHSEDAWISAQELKKLDERLRNNLVSNSQVIIGGGGGGGFIGGGGAAAAAAPPGGATAAVAPPAEEKKEEKEESDDIMGFSLFD
ncbi:hypothetical protein F0562_005582 [Nyssa sinensis]|uniref:CCHC-type domain-containing protein n=1 Tax=Nyssa sinensis TaxID=561372 RepID=A0A5J5AKM5_9ASTE|nr:hypothetical protein F0562_005582 [Nyssa sinensis]